MAGENVVEFTDQNFEQEVINSETPVLVDFWAEWCMPCRMLAPTIDKIAKEYVGKVKVGKLDSFLVLGQVVQVHIDQAFLMENGNFDTAKAQSVARCGYRGDYAKVESLFEMLRPVVS